MDGRIDKRELVSQVAQRVSRDAGTVGEIVEATLEEIYQPLKRGDQVSLRDFGSFYVRPERDRWGVQVQPIAAAARCSGGPPPTGGAVGDRLLEQTYPHIARWIKTPGWIEVGVDDMSRSWIRAPDDGGMVWEGGDSSKSLDEAFEEMDAALGKWMSVASFE